MGGVAVWYAVESEDGAGWVGVVEIPGYPPHRTEIYPTEREAERAAQELMGECDPYPPDVPDYCDDDSA